MKSYFNRAFVFSFGGALFVGMLIPALPTAQEGLLRAVFIQAGLLIVGLAVFYKPKA
jgi:hypothetical protein